MPSLSFASRTFFLALGMMIVALGASFQAIRISIRNQVRANLRTSLVRREAVIERMRSSHGERIVRMVSVATDSAGLKAALGLQRESSFTRSPLYRQQLGRTLQNQLLELGPPLGFDLLIASDLDQKPLAAVVKAKSGVIPLDSSEIPISASSAFFPVNSRYYESIAVPINLAEEVIGWLTLGQEFDIRSFGEAGWTALMHEGRILAANLPVKLQSGFEHGWRRCIPTPEGCDIKVAGESFLALRIRASTIRGDYSLVSFQSIDAAANEFTAGFGSVYLAAGFASVLIALVCAALVARSAARPIRELVQSLEESERRGELVSNTRSRSAIAEINQLANAFIRASTAIRISQQSLQDAYMEFIQTMAQALDARDSYTAGHSRRVSLYSVQIARAMNCSEHEVETVRVGAELHDIGKIGVPDTVLQKPGKLTECEFEMIKQHPEIGSRILGRVAKFEVYLPIVELHHENHDGSGYPHGLRGDKIPLCARIVHVADAYDAMTSDRAYRPRLAEATARGILRDNSGTQFDPDVVKALLGVIDSWDQSSDPSRSLLSLAAQLKENTGPKAAPGEEESSYAVWPIGAGPDIS